MLNLNKKITYLRTYPVQWPIFSTKNYVKDVDGWWNPVKNKRKKKNVLDTLVTNTLDINTLNTNLVTNKVLDVPRFIIIK